MCAETNQDPAVPQLPTVNGWTSAEDEKMKESRCKITTSDGDVPPGIFSVLFRFPINYNFGLHATAVSLATSGVVPICFFL